MYSLGIFIFSEDCKSDFPINFNHTTDSKSIIVNPTPEFLNKIQTHLKLDLRTINVPTVYEMIWNSIFKTDSKSRLPNQVTIYCHKNIECIVAAFAKVIFQRTRSEIRESSYGLRQESSKASNIPSFIHTFDSEVSTNVSDYESDFDAIAKDLDGAQFANVVVVNKNRKLLGFGSTVDQALSNKITSNYASSNLYCFSSICRMTPYMVSDNEVVYTRFVSHKINVFGEYLKYHGMTVVSHVSRSHQDRFAKLLEEMKSKFGHIYSFLPAESMHMTVFNMFTQQVKSEYSKEEVEKYKSKVEKAKKFGEQWTAEVKGRQKVTVKFGYYGSALGSTIGLRVIPKWDVQRERTKLKSLTGLEDRSLDGVDCFHITLGYKFSQTQLSASALEEMEQLIKKYNLNEIEMEEAEITEFFDMTRFQSVKPKTKFSKYVDFMALAAMTV